jgi:C-terminal processing protease CtpA/Prc
VVDGDEEAGLTVVDAKRSARVVVKHLEETGRFFRCGVRVGDVIVDVNGVAVCKAADATLLVDRCIRVKIPVVLTVESTPSSAPFRSLCFAWLWNDVGGVQGVQGVGMHAG